MDDGISVSRRGNKRATTVCFRCHEKKTKCDLLSSRVAKCTSCLLAGYECRVSGTSTAIGQGPATETENPLLLQYNRDSYISGPTSTTQHARNTEDDLPGTSQLDSTLGHVQDSPERARGPGHEKATASYLGESGFLQIFSQDRGDENHKSPSSFAVGGFHATDLPSPALQESYFEKYFKYCYPWCPVLEKDALSSNPAASGSRLLQQALALVACQIEPPVIKHAKPEVYYDHVKALFYSSDEKNPITCISALMLLYWWGSGAPNVVSIDTVWWWTGVAIRQAQQIGLHRELKPGQILLPGETPGLRRRIWWTLFARERLTSICQGRPCIIDPDDCDIAEPTIEDFPQPRDDRVEIFVYWVRLCRIIGRVSKHLSRVVESTPFPVHLAIELAEWVHSLPPHLQLPISSNRTARFNRDVHQLHLPYLSTITLLYLGRASQPLPKAYTAAVLASCCVARIFEDYLSRGSIRFLQGMAGWSVTIAILALLHARKVERLTKCADAHIQILRIALKEIAKLWHSAEMFDRGFERLLGSNAFLSGDGKQEQSNPTLEHPNSLAGLTDLATGGGVDYMAFFPYVTAQTSPLTEMLLNGNQAMGFSELEWPLDLTMMLQDFFEPLGSNSSYSFMS